MNIRDLIDDIDDLGEFFIPFGIMLFGGFLSLGVTLGVTILIILALLKYLGLWVI